MTRPEFTFTSPLEPVHTALSGYFPGRSITFCVLRLGEAQHGLRRTT